MSRTDRLAMDLIYYGESTATCGWDVDGEAMFGDAFRPAAALVVPLGELAIVPDTVGAISVDVHPLTPDLRLAFLDTSPEVLGAANDGRYPVTLPGRGCFVVSVGWSADGRSAAFTGLAESPAGSCA
ncbi:MAG: hypothetical protein ACR2HQ_14220 [Ilumatobacteraceae bacterium]